MKREKITVSGPRRPSIQLERAVASVATDRRCVVDRAKKALFDGARLREAQPRIERAAPQSKRKAAKTPSVTAHIRNGRNAGRSMLV